MNHLPLWHVLLAKGTTEILKINFTGRTDVMKSYFLPLLLLCFTHTHKQLDKKIPRTHKPQVTIFCNVHAFLLTPYPLLSNIFSSVLTPPFLFFLQCIFSYLQKNLSPSLLFLHFDYQLKLLIPGVTIMAWWKQI